MIINNWRALTAFKRTGVTDTIENMETAIINTLSVSPIESTPSDGNAQEILLNLPMTHHNHDLSSKFKNKKNAGCCVQDSINRNTTVLYSISTAFAQII
jgi:hypothetical protein